MSIILALGHILLSFQYQVSCMLINQFEDYIIEWRVSHF